MKKTSKLEVLPPDNNNSWSNILEEHPLIHWMTENGKTLLYAFLGLLLLTVLLIRLISGNPSASETDFLNAEKEFSTFVSPAKEGTDPAVQTEALQNLNKIISAHPELHPKYDALIAETLLIRGEDTKALTYAVPAIKRTSDENDPFYTRFAQITLLIAENNYDQALTDSQALKEQMSKHGQEMLTHLEKIEFSTLLYAYNLLRIGLLQQQLALKSEELKTWQEWKDLLSKSREGSMPRYLDGQLFTAFDNLLSEGTASFASFIDRASKL